MEEKPKNVLYTLNTCPICLEVKGILNRNNVEYELVEVDLAKDEETKQALIQEVAGFNPRKTVPTLVVDGGREVIVGIDDKKYMKEFNIDVDEGKDYR